MNKFLNRFFPVPDALRMPSIGLDISDHSLKYVELLNTGQGIRLGNYGREVIPPGIIEKGTIKDAKKLKDILVILQKKLQCRFVRASLPEEKVYLFDLTIPRIPGEEIEQAVSFQIAEHVPVDPSGLVFDYDLISQSDRNYHIQVHAVPKTLSETYAHILLDSGLTPLSFELEPQAIAKGLVVENKDAPYMLVDIGEEHTNISIVFHDIVMLTAASNFSGETLTLEIANKFQITESKAEFLKKDIGLEVQSSEDFAEKEVSELLAGQVSFLSSSIIKYQTYWESHQGEQLGSINSVIVCGGGANLPGLMKHLSEETGLMVSLAQLRSLPFKKSGKKKEELPVSERLSLATAIGLALGDF